MSTTLSNLVGNLSGKIYNGKCSNCSSGLEYFSTKMVNDFLNVLTVKKMFKKIY